MNSLLQALYQDKYLIKYILQDRGQSRVLQEIQKVFASLLLSSASAVSTKALTDAFGWSSSQVFEQGDISELTTILFDALSKISKPIKELLESRYYGKRDDITLCPECKYSRVTTTPFLEIHLNFPYDGPGSTNAPTSSHTLVDMLREVLKDEVLDEDNKWECSNCSKKVCAVKKQCLSTLPKRFFFFLKRFEFDWSTERRRKITKPVYFDKHLNTQDFSKGSGNHRYVLRSALLHSGTINGGHYRAFTFSQGASQGDDVCLDFNDAVVSELSTQEKENLLWYSDETKDNEERPHGASDIIYESAYLLQYEQIPDNADQDPSTSDLDLESIKGVIAPDVLEEMNRANIQSEALIKAFETHKSIISVVIFVATDERRHYQNFELTGVHRQNSIKSILVAAYEKLANGKLLNRAEFPLEQCRLKLYGKAGITFEGREEQSLSELGIVHPASSRLQLEFEVRGVDEEFKPYDPNAVDISFVMWTDKSGDDDGINNESNSPPILATLSVDPTNQTVGDMRVEAMRLFSQVCNVPLDRVLSDAIVMIHLSELERKRRTVLVDDALLLRDACHIEEGEYILFDVLTSEPFIPERSTAVQRYVLQHQAIVVYFNDPSALMESFGSGLLSIRISAEASVLDFKDAIARRINLPKQSFIIRKILSDEYSPEIKENSTLNLQGVVDKGAVLVEPKMHVGKKVEVKLRLVRFSANTAQHLGPLYCEPTWKVSELKKQIWESWDQLYTSKLESEARPQSSQHIRLRDGKQAGSILSSTILRDQRQLGKCLLGLQDGRRVYLEVLDYPETISNSDLIVSVRVADYKQRNLHAPVPIFLEKDCPVEGLYQAVLKRFFPNLEQPEESVPVDNSPGRPASPETTSPQKEKEKGGVATAADGPPTTFPAAKLIQIAKAPLTGPPLSLGKCQSLKWNEEKTLISGDRLVREQPMGLRDGSVVIARSTMDYEEARRLISQSKPKAPLSATAKMVVGEKGRVKFGSGSSSSKSFQPGSDSHLLHSRIPGSLSKFNIKEKAINIDIGAASDHMESLKINQDIKDILPPTPQENNAAVEQSPPRGPAVRTVAGLQRRETPP
jgi:hypothetical protein